MLRRSLFALPLLGLLPRGAVAEEGKLGVVATFSVLADLVREVGGDRVAVTTLVVPGADAHTFEPRPSDLVALGRAGVLVENGLGLEGWIGRMVQSSGFKGRRIVASAGVKPRTFTEDGRRVTDPHIWQDPGLAGMMVGTIAAGLAAADAAGAEGYASRGRALQAAIEAEDRAIAAAIEAIPKAKRKVITTHDAFGYYGARYGVDFRAAQGISTEAEPTARDLARLAGQIRREHIKAVFVETMTDPRLAATLARESGAVVGPAVYSDSLSPPGGPAATYLAMLRYNTAAFVAAMRAQ